MGWIYNIVTVNPERIKTNDPKEILSLDDQIQAEFSRYILDHDVTSDELEEAYYRLCGIADGEVEDRVKEIVKKMETMVSNGFPLNRYATFVSKLRGYEEGSKNCLAFIDTLSISMKEKQMLSSILTDAREGELEIFIHKEIQPFITINISNEEKDIPENFRGLALSKTLQKALKEVPERALYSFSFNEK